jgi:hypothetical protein
MAVSAPTLAAVRHAASMTPCRRLLLVVPLLLLAGCGGAPEEIGPQGVDGLEVPTPSPDPTDFVRHVDNPYLPLVPGSEWGYRLSGGPAATLLVTVTDDTRVVDGVRTTVVREVERSADGQVLRDTYAWYAQDTDGNVWAFGEDIDAWNRRGFVDRERARGSWEAGVDGAQAGLAMPARPRVGDGYRLEYDEGEAEDQALVVGLDTTRTVAGTTYEGVLVTEETTPLEPGLVERSHYAPGTGLVLAETVSGGEERVELVRARLVASDA